MTDRAYTTKLQAGLGLIPETEKLLSLWEPGMDAHALLNRALISGEFPSMTARRLRNIVLEGFAARYLVKDEEPASALKSMRDVLTELDRRQLYLLFTCRANLILADFIRGIYWPQYSAGAASISKVDALSFVEEAVAESKTTTPWSKSTRTRVSSYLLGACADFGLLSGMEGGARKIEAFRPTSFVTTFLAHDLHFRGLGDSAVLHHEDWLLLGLGPEDALAELKQIALRGEVIVQSAAGLVQISWKHKNMEELAYAVAHS
ncbi:MULTISPECIES: BrxA family protein [unclassified Mesorhizobium]|uniref:BrxA family protein n=1 Tax=unclassified Mesorhizobium TaxID=325217 RepID=UPI002416F051|nr:MULTISPECIES: BrxA family protein [unclassified Mesorhizobium]MDG4901393.1 DUF1819 family protein [Mesorhizobium sp. WSM4962]MDG4918881.1 DUF1819 family protein [Mesorhizobium sp. WSM4989]